MTFSFDFLCDFDFGISYIFVLLVVEFLLVSRKLIVFLLVRLFTFASRAFKFSSFSDFYVSIMHIFLFSLLSVFTLVLRALIVLHILRYIL